MEVVEDFQQKKKQLIYYYYYDVRIHNTHIKYSELRIDCTRRRILRYFKCSQMDKQLAQNYCAVRTLTGHINTLVAYV